MFNWLNRRSRGQGMALSLALMALIGLVDMCTSYEFDLSNLYIAPIILITWTLGHRAGWAMAISCAGLRVATDVVTRRPVSHLGVYLWSFVASGLIFTILVVLITQLHAALSAQYRQARHDPLTALCNRAGFYELAERELARSRRSGDPLTVVYLDCDGFKAVNDRYGHHMGDQVLRAVGATLNDALRPSDVAARMGGDEFVLLLSGVAPPTSQPLVERIAAALDQVMQSGGWPVSFSVGAVTYAVAPESVDGLLAPADALMYTVKHAGKNRVAHQVIPAA
ncbi:GGDEF domain-containing protein [Oscillochloris sp. ZM17-4]|uniref:GGDEF domain-containing protein n=1 Tax=Oscillochloris sp. ZM17-4 TaxID=2866714 RepID=UPI001C73D7FD|nr:GGDEF domain-containing protein [Oscillochloris sp. ZM17-4]MBX0328422.1 GGDEF domain-containing protein [Oscillochloris sp. ZM17-4]